MRVNPDMSLDVLAQSGRHRARKTPRFNKYPRANALVFRQTILSQQRRWSAIRINRIVPTNTFRT